MTSCDTNILLHACNTRSPQRAAATANEEHFAGFGFREVWTSLSAAGESG